MTQPAVAWHDPINGDTTRLAADAAAYRAKLCREAVTADRRQLRTQIRTLRDRDCPYLGHYKLGYDSALDDLLGLLGDDE